MPERAPVRLRAYAHEALERGLAAPARSGAARDWLRAAGAAFGWLLDELAPSLRPTAPTGVHRDVDWLRDTLETTGRADLVDWLTTLGPAGWIRRAVGLSWRIERFWAARHGPDDWQALVAHGRDRRWSYTLIERATAIVPTDRLDVWREILARSEHSPMPAFCRWLAPEHRDVLAAYWDHVDSDAAACAWQAYLHTCPPEVLPSLEAGRMGGGDHLPLWQSLELDRFRHAPPAARPAPVMVSDQTAESHPDHRDPFNRRGF